MNTNTSIMLSFQPKSVTKDLLSTLPERSRRVLTDRFGLAGKGERRTLDAIGQEYGITRERIRQIENHSISAVLDSDAYAALTQYWENLKAEVAALGAVLAEETILQALAKNEAERNHLLFLLTVGPMFDARREDNNFRARWHIDEQLAEQIETALSSLYESIESNKLTAEEEFLELFSKHLKQAGVKNRSNDALPRWLLISKRIGRNPLGEWGRQDSPHVRIKNTRDFAYLTLKRHGSPMHFTEVA